jgi:hypothetical protein
MHNTERIKDPNSFLPELKDWDDLVGDLIVPTGDATFVAPAAAAAPSTSFRSGAGDTYTRTPLLPSVRGGAAVAVAAPLVARTPMSPASRGTNNVEKVSPRVSQKSKFIHSNDVSTADPPESVAENPVLETKFMKPTLVKTLSERYSELISAGSINEIPISAAELLVKAEDSVRRNSQLRLSVADSLGNTAGTFKGAPNTVVTDAPAAAIAPQMTPTRPLSSQIRSQRGTQPRIPSEPSRLPTAVEAADAVENRADASVREDTLSQSETVAVTDAAIYDKENAAAEQNGNENDQQAMTSMLHILRDVQNIKSMQSDIADMKLAIDTLCVLMDAREFSKADAKTASLSYAESAWKAAKTSTASHMPARASVLGSHTTSIAMFKAPSLAHTIVKHAQPGHVPSQGITVARKHTNIRSQSSPPRPTKFVAAPALVAPRPIHTRGNDDVFFEEMIATVDYIQPQAPEPPVISSRVRKLMGKHDVAVSTSNQHPKSDNNHAKVDRSAFLRLRRIDQELEPESDAADHVLFEDIPEGQHIHGSRQHHCFDDRCQVGEAHQNGGSCGDSDCNLGIKGGVDGAVSISEMSDLSDNY